MSAAASFFDTRHQQMAVASEAGAWEIAYRQQVALLESLIEPGMTVLDVGCGPALPYKAPHAYVIGLDPSEASLAQNTDVDERVIGIANTIPLRIAADLVVAFYSVHHMTSDCFDNNGNQAYAALLEMRRALKPGGELLVFEMVPHRWAYLLERVLWNSAKTLLGDRLDACFWRDDLYREALGPDVRAQTFPVSPWATFPPIFAAPWFRLPRFLYPFTPTLFRWRKSPCPS